MSIEQTQMQVAAATLAPAEAEAAIELVDLCKSFGSLTAIDHLSLTVRHGEIFGLLGPNGSGKSTTLNMITGLSAPTSGSVRVLGYGMHGDARKVYRVLGVVPQETALYEELSAWDNLDFHADLFGIPRREKKQRITRILELVQLHDRRNSRVSAFSGGMKRRLALGRALLHDPSLIILDEPTLGVDVQSRRAIWDYILGLRAQGRSVLITTNYLEETQTLCDRIAIIDHGKLIAVDTPEHLKQIYGGSVIEIETAEPIDIQTELRAIPGVADVTYQDRNLTITTQGASDVATHVINKISQASGLRRLALRESTLDEVFLRLTGSALRD